MVLEGGTLLEMPIVDHIRQGVVFIIPAGIEHSLEIKKDFKAIIFIAVDSDINFNKYKIVQKELVYKKFIN